MEKSESIKSLAVAMCKAQSEMGGAHKGANNPFFKSKYADLGEVVKAVKEPFANNGLSYVQFPINDGDRIGVETILMHESGEWLMEKFTVKATKQDAQGAGSVITYCRRYGLQAVAGIPSEDDDGNAASKSASKSAYKVPTPILSAVAKKDIKWIQENWEGMIKNEWGKLPTDVVDNLNKIFNGEY